MRLQRTRLRAAALIVPALAAVAMLARPVLAAPVVGQSAPPLVVRELNGGRFDLRALRGRVVLVSFWATWCSPCRAEMPVLDAFYRRYHRRGLDLIALSLDEPVNAARVRRVMSRYRYPAAFASAARVNGFGMPMAVPMLYVIDSRGVVRERLMGGRSGGVSARALRRAVLPLLAASR